MNILNFYNHPSFVVQVSTWQNDYCPSRFLSQAVLPNQNIYLNPELIEKFNP
jgi:hypothetical protein